MKARPFACAAMLLSMSAGELLGQHAMSHMVAVNADTEAARFIAGARAGTSRYRDRSLAIADGYRQVGPDLPAMGEHWLNIALILADSVDPSRPPVLIYVSSPTGPVLAGVAYTRLLSPTDSYPDFPRGLGAWHDHSGFIDDEALPTHHAGQHGAPNGTRLGILHLWTGVRNAAGDWVPDNWALPFVRVGSQAPTASAAAARALVLASDSGRYFLDVLSTVGHLEAREATQLRSVLAAASREAREVSAPPHPDVVRLSDIWESLWPNVEECLTPAARVRVAEVRRLWW